MYLNNEIYRPVRLGTLNNYQATYKMWSDGHGDGMFGPLLPYYIIGRLQEEVAELGEARTRGDIAQEAADVFNYTAKGLISRGISLERVFSNGRTFTTFAELDWYINQYIKFNGFKITDLPGLIGGLINNWRIGQDDSEGIWEQKSKLLAEADGETIIREFWKTFILSGAIIRLLDYPLEPIILAKIHRLFYKYPIKDYNLEPHYLLPTHNIQEPKWDKSHDRFFLLGALEEFGISPDNIDEIML